MKNLKKVLALALAMTMALSMFVGAGAAFTDQADIKTAEAVDTLVTLGVINGNPDGSFKPDGNVTRAEMAKMIFVIRNGGKTDASSFESMPSSFTDIKGHWAAGYIKYCQTMGIIAGKSATTFDPEGLVTTQEAAKMSLVVMGYKAEKAGLIGTSWAQKTISLASENDLLEDVDSPIAAACSRQYAAQLLFNLLDADCVLWSNDKEEFVKDGNDSSTGSTRSYTSVAEKYMGMSKTVGVLDSVSKETDKDTYTISVDKIDEDSTGKGYSTFTKVKKDYSKYLHQKVKVLYKDKDNVFGVYVMSSDNTVASDVMGNVKMDGGKLKINGEKYSLATAKNTKVYVDGVYGKSSVYSSDKDIESWVTKYKEGATIGKSASVTAISNDDSNKINVLKVTTYDVEKVTYVGKDYINAGSKLKDDDFNYPEGLKKDDYVVISKAGNYADDKGLVTKAETVEGKVIGTKGKNEVKIGDNWYEAAYQDNNDVATVANWPTRGANVKLVLVNGYVAVVDTVTAGSADIALVIETGSSSGLGSSKVADLMFADGTRKVVNLDNDSYRAGVDSTTRELVSYEITKGKYVLTKIDASNKVGYYGYEAGTGVEIDGRAKGTFTGTEALNSLYFAKEAVVFVRYKATSGDVNSGDYKIVSGKDVANWSKKTGVSNVTALTQEDSNNRYAHVAFIDLDTMNVSGGSNSTYAFALGDSYEETIDGTKYTFVKAWNGSEEVTFKSEDSVSINAREAFEYSENSDGTVSLETLASNKVEKTAITSYDDNTGYIEFVTRPVIMTAGKDYKVDSKDTVVLYVDSDDKEGAGEVDIEVAEKDEDGNFINNCIVYVDEAGDDYVTLLVFDVNNEMKN